jgi:anti-sigma-K factor RskA
VPSRPCARNIRIELQCLTAQATGTVQSVPPTQSYEISRTCAEVKEYDQRIPLYSMETNSHPASLGMACGGLLQARLQPELAMNYKARTGPCLQIDCI